MMDCANCKNAIEDDSFFCDQCGNEIQRCSACSRPGKGKRCIHCGKPMTSARDAGANVSEGKQGTAISAAAAAGNSGSAHPPQPGREVGRLKLFSQVHGIDIEPNDGEVLGRRFGPYVAILSRFSQISSNHLKVRRIEDGTWRVADLNSFNNTFYNGTKLVPHQESQVFDGGRLALGDVELQVIIK
jgi:hypothetical protein